jgi:putative addiction module component (TIGR02574 family)
MATEIQLEQMSVQEKLQLVDELWLSMASELDSLDMVPEVKHLLDQRWSAFLEDPSVALTLEEFQQRMKAARE